jgi:hypothetical protein
MRSDRPVSPNREPASPTGVPTAEGLASFLRHLAGRRGRSGRVTSPQTVRAYTSALPTAFAGIADLSQLAGPGREQLHTNIRTAWGDATPSTFNARLAAVGSALDYFAGQDWAPDAARSLRRRQRPRIRARRHRVRPRPGRSAAGPAPRPGKCPRRPVPSRGVRRRAVEFAERYAVFSHWMLTTALTLQSHL